jgi:ATP-dependent Lon protease
LPKENQKDMVEIPEEIKRNVKFLFVETMDQVLKLALGKKSERKSPGKKTTRQRKRSSK